MEPFVPQTHEEFAVFQMQLGGVQDYYQRMNAARLENGLSPLTENTHEVCCNMRASSPPASAVDLLEQQQAGSTRRARLGFKKVG